MTTAAPAASYQEFDYRSYGQPGSNPPGPSNAANASSSKPDNDKFNFPSSGSFVATAYDDAGLPSYMDGMSDPVDRSTDRAHISREVSGARTRGGGKGAPPGGPPNGHDSYGDSYKGSGKGSSDNPYDSYMGGAGKGGGKGGAAYDGGGKGAAYDGGAFDNGGKGGGKGGAYDGWSGTDYRGGPDYQPQSQGASFSSSQPGNGASYSGGDPNNTGFSQPYSNPASFASNQPYNPYLGGDQYSSPPGYDPYSGVPPAGTVSHGSIAGAAAGMPDPFRPPGAPGTGGRPGGSVLASSGSFVAEPFAGGAPNMDLFNPRNPAPDAFPPTSPMPLPFNTLQSSGSFVAEPFARGELGPDTFGGMSMANLGFGQGSSYPDSSGNLYGGGPPGAGGFD